jgi:thiol:disulfide interchange protein DsbC
MHNDVDVPKVLIANFFAVIAAIILLHTSPAFASDELDAIVEKIAMRMPALKGAEAVRSPVAGIIEIRYSGGVLYASEDARYLFGGPLLDVNTRVNLTEQYAKGQRAEILAAIPESSMIVFEPEGEAKYTITTFTDIDCGYCRKLHSQMAEYNALGIRLRYLLYPRAGIGSDAHRKAVAVWCADDRQYAMTKAKAGFDPGAAECSNPVEAHIGVGKKMGLRGTPFSVTEDGTTINGYVAPKSLVRRLAGQ